MMTEAERTIQLWRAAEMFSPRPLPGPDVRENVVDVADGEPLPWEPDGRQAGRSAIPGKTWRHEVFGGIFPLGKVRGTLTGESALFTCTVSESGALDGGPAVSECAWAVGQLALGDEAAGSGDPSSWLTASSGAGRLRVARENLPAMPEDPLTAAGLSRFTAELAELLGVADLLEPAGFRVRSFQAVTGTRADGASPLAGYFAADLARVAAAVGESSAGLPLLTFLGGAGPREPGGTGREPEGAAGSGLTSAEDTERVDIRRHPLTVRDGCTPDRMPAGRWPADAPLVLSEQFAVNEITVRNVPLSAVDAGTDGMPGATAAVFSDLIASVVTERARVMADLSSPEAAFGTPVTWGAHSVAPPAPALTGFEILVAAPSDDAGLRAVGAGWRDRAAEAGYFASTARLAGGESWAMIRAHLGDAAGCRAFTDRFWHGRVHGSEVLFSAGESMRAALREPLAGGWPGAVARFRSALAEVDFLSSERMMAAATLSRFSALEQACEDAYSSLEEAEARVADLVAREPDARDAVIAAEERRRAALEDLRAHQGDRPGLAVAMSTGLRAGREWYAAHAGLRAALDEAARERDEALAAVQALRAELAVARTTMTDARDAVTQLAAAMESLQAPVGTARKRWGDHVPEGPSYAETEDTALIERRENSAPWSDPEFAAARAALFLAALTLHKSLLCANAAVVEANLAAWADIVSGGSFPAEGDQESGGYAAGPPPPEVMLAAWQSFFLVVPVVSASFQSIGSLLSGLGRGSVGWLLAAGTGGIPPRHAAGALWRANHAVFAGTLTTGAGATTAQVIAGPGGSGDGGDLESALSRAARATRFGTWLPDGTWTGLPLHPRPGDSQSPGGSPSGDTEMLLAVLSDLRQRARSRRASRTA